MYRILYGFMMVCRQLDIDLRLSYSMWFPLVVVRIPCRFQATSFIVNSRLAGRFSVASSSSHFHMGSYVLFIVVFC